MIKPDAARTSYAHGRADLPGGDPFSAKLREARIKRLFEAESAPDRARERQALRMTEAERRHGSKMVRDDHPHPAPRPSPALARDADRAAFVAKWSAERQRSQRAELQRSKDTLLRDKQGLRDIEGERQALAGQASSGDLDGSIRQAFKLSRRLVEAEARGAKRDHAVTRIRTDR